MGTLCWSRRRPSCTVDIQSAAAHDRSTCRCRRRPCRAVVGGKADRQAGEQPPARRRFDPERPRVHPPASEWTDHTGETGARDASLAEQTRASLPGSDRSAAATLCIVATPARRRGSRHAWIDFDRSSACSRIRGLRTPLAHVPLHVRCHTVVSLQTGPRPSHLPRYCDEHRYPSSRR
jgi:hypothetical protein